MRVARQVVIAGIGVTVLAVGAALTWARDQGPQAAPGPPITIPFESHDGLILLPVRVNGSPPLTFVLDSGARPSLVSLERARALQLSLAGSVTVGGTGAGAATGAFVRQATVTLDGLPGVTAPVTLAIPLEAISRRAGRQLDGILGTDFMRTFVVALDYAAHTVTFHDPGSFEYHGPGVSAALATDRNGHPTFKAALTPIGRSEIDITAKLDLGATGAVTLHTPFVQAHGLGNSDPTTSRLLGAAGVAGRSSGRAGRLASLRIGGVALDRPPAVFSADTSGAFSTPDVDAHIGARILSRFRVFLDLARGTLILEPTAQTAATFDRASAGLALEAEGPEFAVIRVTDVLEDGAGAAAGLRVGDVIEMIDGARPESLLAVRHRLERLVPCRLTVIRDGKPVSVTLTPRPARIS